MHKQIKPEDLRSKFMTNIIDFELKCRDCIFVIDFDITVSTLVTQYLIQEIGADNTYIIVKAAPSSVEFDLKPVRDICYMIDCSHILIIAPKDKSTILAKLHKQINKNIVLLTDDKTNIANDVELEKYCTIINLTQLVP